MKKNFLLFFLLISTVIFAQGTYYNAINVSDPELITKLHNLINPHTVVSYDSFDETNIANFASYSNPSGGRSVTCVYSSYVHNYTGKFSWGTMSREHTWCHSWMPSGAEGSPQYSDQHHLFPTNQNQVNGVRSNYPLGEVVTVTSKYLEGTFGKDAKGNTVYEPRASHKGDAARALFYMSVCYDGQGGRWTIPNNLMNQDQEVLKKWNKLDPPDEWELKRNDYVYSIQKNRNPFVDHPEYADYIDFKTLTYIASPAQLAAEPSSYVTNFSSASVTDSSITLKWTDAAGAQLPSGYLLVASAANGTLTVPADGYNYPADSDLSDGSAKVKIAYAAADSFVFSNLKAGTAYKFRIYSFNGDANTTNYKTDGSFPEVAETTKGTFSGTVELFAENFETDSLGKFTAVNLAGNKNWIVQVYQSNHYASMTNYQADATCNDWLITAPLKFDDYVAETLTFKTQNAYNVGEALEVMVSTNYSGSGDPTAATWTKLSATLDPHTGTGYGKFTESGNVDLSSYTGTGYVAFHYYGPNTTTWSVDDVVITGQTKSSEPVAPVVSTAAVSDVQKTTAVAGGTVSFDGGSAITSAGVCWSTNVNPTLSDNTVSVSTTTGSFTTTISGLSAGKVYHVRAYATNSIGTSYGNDVTFKTQDNEVVIGAEDLFISEYVEGSSNNKYIEIFNGTGRAVDLADYKLLLYTNGGIVAKNDKALSGTLENNSVKVYRNTSAVVYKGEAEVSDAANFNGDDAIALFKISANSNVDIFGVIGSRPLNHWYAPGNIVTNEMTLVRKSSVTKGIKVNPAAGDSTAFLSLATEWDVLGRDDVSNLGVHTMILSSVEESRPVQAVSDYLLTQNYPNPFNPSTQIEFHMPQSGNVRLCVYNSLGEIIKTLYNGFATEGIHRVDFNGDGLSSGIYLYRLETAGFSATRKMLLVK